MQLIIDDGVPSRGHRFAIFNPNWKVHGCYTGSHGLYKTMTVQNFAGGFVEKGAKDPLKELADTFLAETVDFGDCTNMPKKSEIRSWQDTKSCQVDGFQVTKTCTRTYSLVNGSKVQIEKILFRTFEF